MFFLLDKPATKDTFKITPYMIVWAHVFQRGNDWRKMEWGSWGGFFQESPIISTLTVVLLFLVDMLKIIW